MGDALGGLTPTQYLVMDVLAARYRLGEPYWTFPNAMSTALGWLSRNDYLDFKSGVCMGTQTAWLTDKGARFLKLDRPYAINGKQVGQVWGEEESDVIEGIAEKHFVPVRVLKACSELIDLRTAVPAPGARGQANETEEQERG